jgi:hypothetical protein
LQSILVEHIGELVYWYQYHKSEINESGIGILLDVNSELKLSAVLVGQTIHHVPNCDVEILGEDYEDQDRISSEEDQ